MSLAAAIYCRISQDLEGRGLGVERQRRDCEALAQKRGWNIVGLFVDNDMSAYSSKPRPQYRSLLAAIESRSVEAVLCWHPDRLHRSPRDLEDFIDLIEMTGAAVATCTAGDIDLSSPDGRLMARIVGSVARKESEDKSRRLRRKHLELAELGKLSGGGRRPFGYEADRLTLRTDEALEIARAAQRILEGESVRAVVQDWTARNILTVTGAGWSSTTVKRLLASGRIAGQREHHGRLTGSAVWPAIITPDQSIQLKAILTNPARNRGAGVVARRYLLSGLVHCGRCGARMTTRPTARGRRRYYCAVDRGGCGRCGIDADGLEALLSEAVLQRLSSPSFEALIRNKRAVASDVASSAQSNARQLELRLDELADVWAAGEISRTEWLRARESVHAKLERVKAELSTVPALTTLNGLSDQSKSVREAWAGLSMERQRLVLREVLSTITVAAAAPGLNRFEPERIDIVWRA